MSNRIINEYFRWMSDTVCGKRYSKHISFKKLLTRLHQLEFSYTILMDKNRAEDGISLRRRFAMFNGYEDSIHEIVDILDGPCSVLEMMVALAIRIEEDIMDDPDIGNRTGQWFWGMIVSLGLGSMVDDRFDKIFVDDVIDRFLGRDYSPEGKGGLFTIRDCEHDLRRMEIWHQMCWYVNSIS